MNPIPVIVIGAGGHAVVVADALLAARRQVLGFLDADAGSHGRCLLGLPVLGGDVILEARRGSRLELVNGIGGVGKTATTGFPIRRRHVQERLQLDGWHFATVVHPRAIVSPHATLQIGAQVLAGAVVQAGANVGEGAIVNTCAVVEHHGQVGAYAHIAPGAVLCGDVQVGEECHVGAGAVVRQGLKLAARSVVGIGAAVVRDVHTGTVLGVPAVPRGSMP